MTRTMTTEHPADEKARLIKEIRQHLPYVAIGHPDLAREIARAMDIVEGVDERLRDVGLLATDQTKLGVGVEVVVLDTLRQRLGLIVQMGDEDDHPGRVLVYEGTGSEYPAWWSADYVVPRAFLLQADQPAAGEERAKE